MSSPFPGVNPYIEESSLWEGFHNEFITYLAYCINKGLPDTFVARTEQRVYVLPHDRRIKPDVLIVPKPIKGKNTGGSTALLERATPSGMLSVPEEVRENYITIRKIGKQGEVVTIIELLSPTNKNSEEGRREYLKKQREVLHSDTHFVEIDLLKQGTHTVAMPLDILKENSIQWDYLISSRRTDYDRIEFWANLIAEVLPIIRIPLTEDYNDLAFDLQEVYTMTFNNGYYQREFDYNNEISTSWSRSQKAWMDKLLREKGLRTA